MTTDERIDKLTQAFANALDSIHSLERIAAGHQSTIEAHDRQIEGLIAVAEKHAADAQRQTQETALLKQALIDLSQQWQAYLRRIPPQ